MKVISKVCAGEIMEVVPLMMRSIRRSMRERHSKDLSMSQFRILLYLHHRKGKENPSLSAVAQFLGVKLPTASKVVDGLTERKLVERLVSPSDRRHMHLVLSKAGEAKMLQMRAEAENQLCQRLEGLSVTDCSRIREAMEILKPVFSQNMGDRC